MIPRLIKILSLTCFLLVFATQTFAFFNSDVKKAKEFMKAGMYPQAISLLKKSIDEKPTNAEAHFELGTCYMYQGRTAMADERFSSAVKLNSKYGYKIAETYKKGAEEAARKRSNIVAGDLYIKAVKYDPKYKAGGYSFFKRLGDTSTTDDSKVDCYLRASDFASKEQKEKLGLKVIKIAASRWQFKDGERYQEIAARFIGHEKVKEIFPGYQDVVIYESPKPLTIEDAFDKEYFDIELIDMSKQHIKRGDIVEVYVEAPEDGKGYVEFYHGKYAPEDKKWEPIKNGYFKIVAALDKREGSLVATLNKRRDAKVRTTIKRKLLQKPKIELISKLLQ